MGNCHSKKEKNFNNIKNSVVLTKQKTDKKVDNERLKIVNENYRGLQIK